MTASSTSLRLSSLTGRLRNALSPGRRALLSRPFYRRYPFRSPLSLRKADARGVIHPDLVFFYNRVPKAANTTIVQTLVGACDLGERSREELHAFFLKPSQLSAEQTEQLNQAFRFTFCRNPYTRVLSAYLDKVVNGPRGRRRKGQGAPPSFPEFCEYLQAGALYRDPHWIPQCELLLLPPESLDFIGRFEQLDADLEHVCRAIAPDYREPPTICAPHRTGAAEKIEAHFDERSRAIIESLYAMDFDRLGYSRDLANAA